MINFDYLGGKNIQKHNPNWPLIPDHPCKILINGGSRYGKINALLNKLPTKY